MLRKTETQDERNVNIYYVLLHYELMLPIYAITSKYARSTNDYENLCNGHLCIESYLYTIATCNIFLNLQWNKWLFWNKHVNFIKTNKTQCALLLLFFYKRFSKKQRFRKCTWKCTGSLTFAKYQAMVWTCPQIWIFCTWILSCIDLFSALVIKYLVNIVLFKGNFRDKGQRYMKQMM